jgi:hypothetical protein
LLHEYSKYPKESDDRQRNDSIFGGGRKHGSPGYLWSAIR